MQLDHYKNIETSKADDAPTPEQVQMQRRKLQETAKLNAMLKAEEARNSRILAQLQTLVGANATSEEGKTSPFAFLAPSTQANKNSASSPLNQNVQYALTQVPALRQLLTKLKESLQTLPNARHSAEDDSSVEAKRRQYVEIQSRRALERKGIDLEDASVAAASTGRRIGRDEVAGIEAVVHALGGAEGVRRSNDDMEE